MSVLLRNLARLFSTSSDPSGSAGDVWWNSALSQVRASDGSGSLHVGPAGNLPVVRSGAWHSLPTQGSSTGLNIPDGRLFALPLWPGRSCSVSAVAANVTLALVGGSLRMGLYASDGALPTSLVADYGTVGAGVTGIRQISGLSTPLRPTLYFLVVGRQGGALTLAVSSRITHDSIVSGDAPILSEDHNAYFIDGVSGALPSSFGTIGGTATGPALSVQLS